MSEFESGETGKVRAALKIRGERRSEKADAGPIGLRSMKIATINQAHPGRMQIWRKRKASLFANNSRSHRRVIYLLDSVESGSHRAPIQT
jgi:hypothetical protein